MATVTQIRVFHHFVVIADQLVRASGRRKQNMTGQFGMRSGRLGSTAGAGDDTGWPRRRRGQGEGRIEVIDLERPVAVPLGLRRVERIGERLRGSRRARSARPQTVGGRAGPRSARWFVHEFELSPDSR